MKKKGGGASLRNLPTMPNYGSTPLGGSGADWNDIQKTTTVPGTQSIYQLFYMDIDINFNNDFNTMEKKLTFFMR